MTISAQEELGIIKDSERRTKFQHDYDTLKHDASEEAQQVKADFDMFSFNLEPTYALELTKLAFQVKQWNVQHELHRQTMTAPG